MFENKNAAISKLVKRSQKTLDVFTRTSNELREINKEISDNIASRDAEIERINAEKADLKAIQSSNEKVMDKITKLFE